MLSKFAFNFNLRRYILVAEVLETSVAEETVLPVFFALLRDPVWAVRKACADELVALSKAMSRVGPGRWRPPRHRVPFNSGYEGSKGNTRAKRVHYNSGSEGLTCAG